MVPGSAGCGLAVVQINMNRWFLTHWDGYNYMWPYPDPSNSVPEVENLVIKRDVLNGKKASERLLQRLARVYSFIVLKVKIATDKFKWLWPTCSMCIFNVTWSGLL